MAPLTKTILRAANWMAGALRPPVLPVRFENGEADAAQSTESDLSTPGQFKTCRGPLFRHGVDSSPDDVDLQESRWIAFEGVRLRVSLYRSESGTANRLTFCGKDAPGCSEARGWAARLQRANGVRFPSQEVFAQFCEQLGWSPDAVETMLGIYPTD